MGFLVGLLGGGRHRTSYPTAASSLQLQSSSRGLPIPIVYGATRVAPNLIWYGDFIATAHQSAPAGGGGGKGGVGGGGGGKGGGGGSISYTYAAAVAMALCEGPISNVNNAYVDKNITSLSSLGFSLFTGSYSQSPWGYLTTNHPGQDLNYHGIAYLGASSYQLGNSPQLPNHNFEVYGILYGTAPNGTDADPSQVFTDLLSNAKYGAGLPSSKIGSLTIYKAYCLASGLWISPCYNTQTQTSALIDDIAVATNSGVLWASGLLTLVSYGDQNVSAHGYSYTAPTQTQYSLGDDDYVRMQGQDPVQMNRKRPADTINSIKVECLDRNNSYNPAVIESKDQALIDLYGLRQSPSKQLHLFADITAARLSAALQLGRQAIRNVYTFTLDQRYIQLDPMDLVDITESVLGLTNQWVRITEITEDENGNLSITAEEYLNGSASAPAYTFQNNSGYNADYNTAPGNANVPTLFEPPVQVSYTGGLEVDIACSGGSNWGGCDVYISSDNSTYKNVGRITGPARMGTLTAILSTHADPDTVDTLSVDLGISFGELTSGTQADADAYHTICYCDGEIISYETATLVTGYQYNLTYLRRGGYGSTISTHMAGSNFVRMDKGVFPVAYDKSQIGNTIYIKLTSFNLFGGGEQSLADVVPITYTIVGPPGPPQVTDFQISQGQLSTAVVFKWIDVVTDLFLKGYDIAFGAVGSAWDIKQLLTEAHRGTEMTNADVPPGPWEFSIRAHDQADQLGPESLVEFTVQNPNNLVVDDVEEPGWIGNLNNFVLHPTGVLIPENQFTPSHYTDYTLFLNFVPHPVASASYITRTIDVGYDTNLRVYGTQAASLGVGQTGSVAVPTFAIDTWLSAGSDPNSYTDWTSGYVTFRYLNGRVTYASITSGNVSFFTDFTILADIAPATQQSGQIVVSPGGTTLTFPNAYHSAPYVTATVVSSSPLYASVVSVTATNCIIHAWSGSSDTGGVCNWIATGT